MNLPAHFSEEKRLHNMIVTAVMLVALFVSLSIITLNPVIQWIVSQPLNLETWSQTRDYFTHILFDYDKLITAQLRAFTGNPAASYSILLAGLTSFILIGITYKFISPYNSLNNIYGNARFANLRTLQRMEEDEKVSISKGKHLILGRMKASIGTSLTTPYVQMMETLSVLLMAPPGTGKTAGFIVPSILASDHCSMVVNDPKPELFDMTSGHRSKVSHVFKIDWSSTDDPARGIYYPRFNFLDPQTVPKSEAGRDTYFDAIAKVLVPEEKGKGDSFFEPMGRAALTGFLHYIFCKVSDNKNYNGVPNQWIGKPPSIPMLVDFLAHGMGEASKIQKEKKEAKEKAGKHHFGDATTDWFAALVTEAEEGKYSVRAINALKKLEPMSSRQRDGIMSTMDKAFLPFNNAAVKERTSDSDFRPSDLRGIKDPVTGKWKPVSLYVCVNQAEASAFTQITSLLFEVLSLELLAYGPRERNKNGVRLGPFAVCFALDEYAKLPPTKSVMEGPDLGRSKQTFYLFVAQDFSQIKKLYSEEDIEIIITTTAIKIVLPQNNDKTAERIIKMVGNTTIGKQSKSRNLGFSKNANPFAANVSEQTEKADLLRMNDVSSMRKGTQLVLVQGFQNYPLQLEIPFFFKDKTIMPKVYNLRTGMGPKPSAPLSADLLAIRKASELVEQREACKIIDFLKEKERVARQKRRQEQAMTAAGGSAYANTEASASVVG